MQANSGFDQQSQLPDNDKINQVNIEVDDKIEHVTENNKKISGYYIANTYYGMYLLKFVSLYDGWVIIIITTKHHATNKN